MEDNARNGREVSSAAASRRAYETALQAVHSGQVPANMNTMRALAILQQSAKELEELEAKQKELAAPGGMVP